MLVPREEEWTKKKILNNFFSQRKVWKSKWKCRNGESERQPGDMTSTSVVVRTFFPFQSVIIRDDTKKFFEGKNNIRSHHKTRIDDWPMSWHSSVANTPCIDCLHSDDSTGCQIKHFSVEKWPRSCQQSPQQQLLTISFGPSECSVFMSNIKINCNVSISLSSLIRLWHRSFVRRSSRQGFVNVCMSHLMILSNSNFISSDFLKECSVGFHFDSESEHRIPSTEPKPNGTKDEMTKERKRERLCTAIIPFNQLYSFDSAEMVSKMPWASLTFPNLVWETEGARKETDLFCAAHEYDAFSRAPWLISWHLIIIIFYEFDGWQWRMIHHKFWLNIHFNAFDVNRDANKGVVSMNIFSSVGWVNDAVDAENRMLIEWNKTIIQISLSRWDNEWRHCHV